MVMDRFTPTSSLQHSPADVYSQVGAGGGRRLPFSSQSALIPRSIVGVDAGEGRRLPFSSQSALIPRSIVGGNAGGECGSPESSLEDLQLQEIELLRSDAPCTSVQTEEDDEGQEFAQGDDIHQDHDDLHIVQANFSQFDVTLESVNQCSAMIGLAHAATAIEPVQNWVTETLNRIIIEGDNYFRSVHERLGIEGRSLQSDMLAPDEVSGIVQFDDTAVLVTTDYDSYINGFLNGYPDMQGLPTMEQALHDFVESGGHNAFLVSGGYTFGIFIEDTRENMYMLDTHMRDSNGLIHPKGVACLLRYSTRTAPHRLSEIVHSNIGRADPARADVSRNMFSLIPTEVTIVPSAPARVLRFDNMPEELELSTSQDAEPRPSSESELESLGKLPSECSSPIVHANDEDSLADDTTNIVEALVHEGNDESEVKCDTEDELRMESDPSHALTTMKLEAVCCAETFLKTKCGEKLIRVNTLDHSEVLIRRIRAEVGDSTASCLFLCNEHLPKFSGWAYRRRQKDRGCIDPFNRHLRKVHKGILEMEESDVRSISRFGLFTDGMWWCPTCRVEAKRRAAEFEESGNQSSDSIDSTSSVAAPRQGFSSSSATEDSEGEVVEQMEHESILASTLENLNQTPVNTKRARGKRARMLYNKFERSAVALKRRFSVLADWKSPTAKKSRLKSPQVLAPSQLSQTLQDLKKRFEVTINKRDRYLILTTTPERMSAGALFLHFGCTLHEARTAAHLRAAEGAFSFPESRPHPSQDAETKDLVKRFYLLDECSRPMAGSRDTRIIREDGEKTVVAKRLIQTTLPELYKKFTEQLPGVKIGMSTFAKLRPVHCRWQGPRGHHSQCLCAIHENFKLLLVPVLGRRVKAKDILPRFVCNTENSQCMMSLCNNCPEASVDVLTTTIAEDEIVSFEQWVTVDRADIRTVQMNGADYVEEIRNYLPKILQHEFISRQQQNFVKSLKEGLENNATHCVVQIDYAENFTSLVQDAVQSYRWSNIQSTLHPFYVTYYDQVTLKIQARTIAVISDNLVHDTNAVAAFISYFIPELRRMKNFDHIHYVSDGCGGQYKNFKYFCNLLHHYRDFGISADHHFSATSHGKNECDAVMAATKASARRHSLRGNLIRSPEELFKYCNEELTTSTRQFIYVPSSGIDQYVTTKNLIGRYSGGRTIPGTRSYHSVVPLNQNTLRLRKYSTAETYTDHCLLPDDDEEEDVARFDTARVGEYVLVKLNNTLQLGVVNSINTADMTYSISFMKKGNHFNSFKWPDTSNVKGDITNDEIVAVVGAPVTTTGRIYRLSDVDAVLLR